jgi:proteic killer suppression protein
MIVSFKDHGTRDVFEANDTRDARQVCPQTLWPAARKKLDLLDRADALPDLIDPPGNRLERLKGDRAGQWSIRINRRYRICFWWTQDGPGPVEIVDYH